MLKERGQGDRLKGIPNDAETSRAPNVPATLSYARIGAKISSPARLVALAVVGLIYNGILFLGSVLVVGAGGYALVCEPPRELAPPPPPIPMVWLEPYTGDAAGADGLKLQQRRLIVAQLRGQLRLSDDRAEMLERLLADVGARMFPSATSVDLDNHGQTSDGYHYFHTARGRAFIADFSAAFYAIDGSRVLLVRNVLHDHGAQARWSAIAIAEALDEAQAKLNGALTALQGAAILKELRSYSVVSDADWSARPRLDSLRLWEQGTITWRLRGDSDQWLLADGRSTSVGSAPLGVDPVTGVPYAAFIPRPYVLVAGSRAAIAALALAAFCEALLAAYLLVGCVQILRTSLEGVHRHIIFLLWKIPLLLLSGAASIWWLRSLREYAVPSFSHNALLVEWSLFMLSYAVAVLVVLNMRRVTYFFAGHSYEPWAPVIAVNACVRATFQTSSGRSIAALAIALLVSLALVHLLMWAASAWLWQPSSIRSGLHLAGAAVGLALAGAMWRLRARAALSGLLVLSFTCSVGVANQPATQARQSPWAIHELLVRARSVDRNAASRAIGELADADELGQEAILQLLEGPEPPIGIDRIVQIVGESWQSRAVRWEPRYHDRAMALSLEWIESIQRTRDVRGVALLEALAKAQDLEPLLRPLLVCDDDDVRARIGGLLITINSRPIGMIRLLERDLAAATNDRAREAIISGLTHLRPSSDVALARLLRESNPTVKMVLRELSERRRPLSQTLLDQVKAHTANSERSTRTAAIQLLAQSRGGRAIIIDVALSDYPHPDAMTHLKKICRAAEPIFWRIEDVPEPAIREAARLVLHHMNEHDGQIVADSLPLGDVQTTNDEIEIQSRLVRAGGNYGGKLGPFTYRLIRHHHEPTRILSQDPAARWRAPPQQKTLRSTRPRSPPPLWISIGLLAVTVGTPAMVLLGSVFRASAGARSSPDVKIGTPLELPRDASKHSRPSI